MSRRSERRARRRREAARTQASRLYLDGVISAQEYADRVEAIRTGAADEPRRRSETEELARLKEVVEPILNPSGPPEFLRCPVCRGVVPDHAEHCFMRPGAQISAPRGGIAYERRPALLPGARWDAHGGSTPLYDELAAERGIDPCRDASVRRNDDMLRRLRADFARSFATPSPTIVVSDAARGVEVTDPVVEHARELYCKGHLGDVGSFTARRALARMISGSAFDEIRTPRFRTGWGQPIERTDP